MKNKTIVSGTIWTFLSTITTAMVQILRLSILAHFLDKNDFGIVAILTMILGFTNTFSELGFSTIIMYKQDITSKEFSSLYWTQFILYIIIYLLFSSASCFVSSFFNESSIIYLLPIAMLDIILYGVGRLYDTILQKELKFQILAKRNILASVISLIVAVVLAYNGHGVYSLIISTLVQSIILNFWNLIQGQRCMSLELYCSFRLIKPVLNIGFFQTWSNILDYISTKIDILIIGKLLGSEVLGVYNLAKELILKCSMLLNTIVNRVSLPLFAKKQREIDLLQENYSKLLGIVSLINFPICAIIGALGYVIIPIIYGERYMDVVPILFILSIWGLFNCIGNPVNNIVISVGRTDMSFKYTIIRLICYIPVMLILSSFNVFALSWGVTSLTAVFIFISWYMLLYKTIHLDFRKYSGAFILPLIITICFEIFGYILIEICYMCNISLVFLYLVSFCWIIMYIICFLFIEKSQLNTILKLVRS